MFEYGKVYRFIPTKTRSFNAGVRNNNLEYSDIDLWQLEIEKNIFMYKGKMPKEELYVDGYLIKRCWCEEIK